MKRFIFAAAIAILPGCGGGTSGTSSTEGFEKVFQGAVVDQNGAPVAGAALRLSGGGGRGTTDDFGRFVFAGTVEGSTAALEVEKDGLETEVALANLSAEPSIIGFEIGLGGDASASSNVELSLISIGGGGCEGAFGKSEVITFASDTPPLLVVEQTQALPDGTECTVQARIKRNGLPEEGIGFQLVFVDLSPAVPAQDVLAQGATDAAGTGSLSFTSGGDIGGNGYLVLETPLSLPSPERVGIVISLMR